MNGNSPHGKMPLRQACAVLALARFGGCMPSLRVDGDPSLVVVVPSPSPCLSLSPFLAPSPSHALYPYPCPCPTPVVASSRSSCRAHVHVLGPLEVARSVMEARPLLPHADGAHASAEEAVAAGGQGTEGEADEDAPPFHGHGRDRGLGLDDAVCLLTDHDHVRPPEEAQGQDRPAEEPYQGGPLVPFPFLCPCLSPARGPLLSHQG